MLNVLWKHHRIANPLVHIIVNNTKMAVLLAIRYDTVNDYAMVSGRRSRDPIRAYGSSLDTRSEPAHRAETLYDHLLACGSFN